MPFAPKIRRDILNALDNYIIPALWKQYVPLGYIAPPLDFPDGIHAKLITSKIPAHSNNFRSFLNNGYWPEAKLHSTVHSYLSFIFEGSIVEHTLINEAQASKYCMEQGIYSVQTNFPSILYFPGGMPRNCGKKSFLESASSSVAKVLEIALLDQILVHTHIETATRYEVSHSLQVHDPELLMLATLLEEEIQNKVSVYPNTAQAALLTFMLRLRHYFASFPARLANTSIPPTTNLPSSMKRDSVIYRKAIYFVQTHLHERPSLSRIADELDISPTQLNRYFRKFAGTSTMNYMQKQRIEAAKSILMDGQENIEEIALLLGYKYSAAFCTAFRKEVGVTPLKFRQKFVIAKD